MVNPIIVKDRRPRRVAIRNAARREWCERLLALALIVLAAVATVSHADTPAPVRSWRKEVGPDKKYVFVMQIAVCRWGIRKTITDAELAQLPPQAAAPTGRAGPVSSCDPQQVLWTKQGGEARELDAGGVTRRIIRYYEVQYADGVSPHALRTASGVPYPVSGLYRNDGSTEPLWSVDWYSFSADLSDDGRYLIRPGPWATFFEEPAIAFYDRGVLLKEYRIADLVRDRSSVSYSVSHFIWSRGGALDQKSLRYRLETTAGDRYEFDATTGAIVSEKSRPPPGRPANVVYRRDTCNVCGTVLVWRDGNVRAGPGPGRLLRPDERTGSGAQLNDDQGHTDPLAPDPLAGARGQEWRVDSLESVVTRRQRKVDGAQYRPGDPLPSRHQRRAHAGRSGEDPLDRVHTGEIGSWDAVPTPR